MKTWFITGANRGLGLETARAALEAGDQVVATCRRPEELVSSLSDHGDRLLALRLDVTDGAGISAAVRTAIARFGRIDALVNNAGYGHFGAFEEIIAEDVTQQFATNVFGVFDVTRAVLPHMRAQRSGHILTVSSCFGMIGADRCSVYCATKFALEGWSESLQLEVAEFGIRTTVLAPGFFRTDFLENNSVRIGSVTVDDYAASTAAFNAFVAGRNHNQAGDPVKFAEAVLILAATEAPPLRVPLGSDSLAVVLGKAEALRNEAAQWRAMAESTDFAAEEMAA